MTDQTSDTVGRLNAALEGRYRIDRELGEGGMATVYLADDLRHERKVALKVLKPELAAVVGADRFLAEIKTTANLQHPHILPLFDSGEADSFLFYVMPYVEGESLREKLNREQQLPVDEAIRIATAVAQALQHAHDREVIHRDIKPGNILIQDGQPVVADFGIALAVGAGGGARMTETGLSVGTPYYMSPEQATGDQYVGPASDIYALGAVLYEMLVGEPPYTGSTAQAVLGKIIQGAPQSATSIRKAIPPNIDAALRASLERLPADRFSRATGFARALSDPGFQHGSAELSSVGGTRGRMKWAAIAGWATAAVFAIAAMWPTEPPPEILQPVLRHSLTIPDEIDVVPNFGPQIDISPDGTRLVYQDAGDEGGQRLWLWERSQLDSRPLNGTEDATQVAFSSDGERVTYITTDRQLKVVALGGQPPLTVVDSGLVRAGVDWGNDGFIYFAEGTSTGNPTAGLGRVSANGGPIESVTSLDTTRVEVSHQWPAVLPNEKGVLFTVSTNELYNPEYMEIAVGDLETGTHTVILEGMRAQWATTGHLLVVTGDGALVAVPFDDETLEVTGPVVPLVDGIALDGFVTGPGVPASAELMMSETGTLVYQEGQQSEAVGEQVPVWVSRTGVVEMIDPDFRRGYYSLPALSPEGDRLAVTLNESGESHVWIKQLDEGPLSKLTFQGSSNVSAAWHPDGQELAFVSNRGDNPDLYVRESDGSGQPQLLLDSQDPIAEVTYSPDGEWAVYRHSNQWDIYGKRIGSNEEPVDFSSSFAVAGNDEANPVISPDGRWLAYQSNESGRWEIYVHPFPNVGDARWQVSTQGGWAPAWSRSGDELYYASLLDLQLMAVPIIEGTTFIHGEAVGLFQVQGFISGSGVVTRFYDVMPGDERFVMILDSQTTGRLVFVENFLEELIQRVGS